MGSAVEPGIEATGSAAGLSGFSAFKFTPTKLRNNGKANSVQVAEVRFQHDGAAVDVSECPTVNPGGHSPANEEPPKGDDGDTHTKWLDFNKGSLVIECNSPKTVDKWTWVTANDHAERDPVQWTLEGATSGAGPWITLGKQTGNDFDTPQPATQHCPGSICHRSWMLPWHLLHHQPLRRGKWTLRSLRCLRHFRARWRQPARSRC